MRRHSPQLTSMEPRNNRHSRTSVIFSQLVRYFSFNICMYCSPVDPERNGTWGGYSFSIIQLSTYGDINKTIVTLAITWQWLHLHMYIFYWRGWTLKNRKKVPKIKRQTKSFNNDRLQVVYLVLTYCTGGGGCHSLSIQQSIESE